MEILSGYILPLGGLEIGKHEFSYKVTEAFLEAFEYKEIDKADFDVNVQLDKSSNNLKFIFSIGGSFHAACDRCLNEIQIPVDTEYRLMGKYGEGEEEADIFYLPADSNELNISQYVYEYIMYSIPLLKVVDCDQDENPPCNFELLDKMDSEEKEDKNSVWDALHKLNLKK